MDAHDPALALSAIARALGVIEGERGNQARASELLRDSLSLYRELGEIWGIATALRAIGTLARRQGEYGEAGRLYRESLKLYEENGDPQAVALVLSDLAGIE